MHFANLISFKNGTDVYLGGATWVPLAPEPRPSGGWVALVLPHPAAGLPPGGSSVGCLCDKVVSCVFSARKGIVTQANSDTWYTPEPEKTFTRGCGSGEVTQWFFCSTCPWICSNVWALLKWKFWTPTLEKYNKIKSLSQGIPCLLRFNEGDHMLLTEACCFFSF